MVFRWLPFWLEPDNDVPNMRKIGILTPKCGAKVARSGQNNGAKVALNNALTTAKIAIA